MRCCSPVEPIEALLKVCSPFVDAPFQARENVRIVAARDRMLSSVRPWVRQEGSRRPLWEFAGPVQITQSLSPRRLSAPTVPTSPASCALTLFPRRPPSSWRASSLPAFEKLHISRHRGSIRATTEMGRLRRLGEGSADVPYWHKPDPPNRLRYRPLTGANRTFLRTPTSTLQQYNTR